MENLKIRVFTEQQAKTVIELAEKLGYKEKYPKSFKLKDGYVCLDGGKDILKVCIDQAGSELNEYKYISMADLSLMAAPQHKEYLDPHNNYELIEWDGGFMIQDHWIAVPDGADFFMQPKNLLVHCFFANDNGKTLNTHNGKKWHKESTLCFENMHKQYVLLWHRDTKPEAVNADATAWDTQVGGNHYKSLAIQPMEYALKNKLDFAQSNVVKYVTRHAEKNGKADLLKAKHYIDLMIEHYYGNL